MARRSRSAGVVAPRHLPRAPTLPGESRFDSSTHGAAYWLVRTDLNGPGELFISSGVRVLRDLRAELGITSGDLVWSEGILSRLSDRARALGARPTGPQPVGEQLVSQDWLALALWVTYSADQFPSLPGVVDLPSNVVLPRLGATYTGPGDTPTEAAADVDPSLWRVNPWSAGVTITGQVDPQPVATTRPAKKRGTGMGLYLAALGALLLARD